MYVNNTQNKNIELRSFGGYAFSVPPGISWIWEKAGEHMLSIHKVESRGGKDVYGFDNGHGLPAVFKANKEEWEKDGKKRASVVRYQINHSLVPKARLITTAKQRGVDNDKITEWLADQQIDASVIAEAINSLPIPEEVAHPPKDETQDDK